MLVGVLCCIGAIWKNALQKRRNVEECVIGRVARRMRCWLVCYVVSAQCGRMRYRKRRRENAMLVGVLCCIGAIWKNALQKRRNVVGCVIGRGIVTIE